MCAPHRAWSVALPEIYERTRIPSRFVTVRPGPPAANCRGAPGRTPGQCERGLSGFHMMGWREFVTPHYCSYLARLSVADPAFDLTRGVNIVN